MSRLIYLRMAGYVTAILLHGGNMVVTARPNKEGLTDPRVKNFAELQNRFLTCWTFFLQILYAVVGLICDLLTLANSKKKDYSLPKYLRGFRDTLFAGVVWPSSVVVFSCFWPIFIYDRSLVFPEFLDKILSPISNHIMHTAILPIVLWEILFQARTTPKSHLRYLGHMTFHFALYFSVLIYTYIERGFWIYPFLGRLYGTIYFPLIIMSVFLLAIVVYYLQWILPSFAYVPEKSRKKVR